MGTMSKRNLHTSNILQYGKLAAGRIRIKKKERSGKKRAQGVKNSIKMAIGSSTQKTKLWVSWKSDVQGKRVLLKRARSTISLRTSIPSYEMVCGLKIKGHGIIFYCLEHDPPPVPHPTSVTALSTFNPLPSHRFLDASSLKPYREVVLLCVLPTFFSRSSSGSLLGSVDRSILRATIQR